MNPKPLIVWDFDDVLFPLTEAWLKASGRTMQSRIVQYEQFTENPPNKIMGIPLSEYLESLDAFRLSPEAQTIEPKKVILNWFAIYGSAYRNEVLTARPLHTVTAAKSWLAIHFPNYFQGFGVVPAARPGVDISGYPQTKRAFLEAEGLKPQFFIDDSNSNISDVALMPEVHTILYPAPWNRAHGGNLDPQKLMNGN